MTIATNHALAMLGVALASGFGLAWSRTLDMEPSRVRVPASRADRSGADTGREHAAELDTSVVPRRLRPATQPAASGSEAAASVWVRAAGRIVPAPGPDAKLWLDSSIGRQPVGCGVDGRFLIEDAPEGRAVLRLDARDLRLGGDGHVVDLSRHRSDLGTIEATRLRELIIECEPEVAGPLYLRREDPRRAPLPSQLLGWPVDEGKSLGGRRWRFAGLDTEWQAGALWSAAGWEGRLEPTPHGVARVRMYPPVELRVRLRVAQGQEPTADLIRGWRLVICPAWAGRAGPWTELALAGKPWIGWRATGVSSDGWASAAGLRSGSWHMALLADAGVVVAEQKLEVGAAQAGRTARVELAWSVVAPGLLKILPPRCTDQAAAGVVDVRYAAGDRIVRLSVEDIGEAGRELALPLGRTAMRFVASACGDGSTTTVGIACPQPDVLETSLDVVPGARHELRLPCSVCARLTGVAGQGWQIDGGAGPLVTAPPSALTRFLDAEGGHHDQRD